MTEQEFNQAAQRHLDMVYRIALNALRRPARCGRRGPDGDAASLAVPGDV